MSILERRAADTIRVSALSSVTVLYRSPRVHRWGVHGVRLQAPRPARAGNPPPTLRPPDPSCFKSAKFSIIIAASTLCCSVLTGALGSESERRIRFVFAQISCTSSSQEEEKAHGSSVEEKECEDVGFPVRVCF